MIPQTIHYCWFGKKPLPKLALKCIASWEKYLPDYEIKEWNESNFDVNQISYTAQAYKCKKYAFVSDYARFKIMYEYGGIYFDTDVEVIKSLDDIIAKGAFFGMEASSSNSYCAPGLGFACPPKLNLCKKMIDYYEKQNFLLPNRQYNLQNVVQVFSNVLTERGFSPSISPFEFEEAFFYPPEYFCPVNYFTGEVQITENTRTIHHYAASWVNKYDNQTLIAKIWMLSHLPNTNIREKMFKIKEFFLH